MIRNNMPKQKINWLDLKQKYFDSEIGEVREFLKLHFDFIVTSYSDRTIATQTKGWRYEKQAYKKDLHTKIQAEVEKKLIKQGANSRIAQINKALEDTEQKVALLIGTPDNQFTFEDLPKIKVGWEILRTVTGQPIKIDKLQGDKENPLNIEIATKTDHLNLEDKIAILRISDKKDDT